MDQKEFLVHVVGEEPGFLCLGQLGQSGEMVRRLVPYPLSEALTDEAWPYFIPARFDENGEGYTRAVPVDVDAEALPLGFVPGLGVLSSHSHFQGYYLTTEVIAWAEAKILSRRIAPTADPSEFFRIPGLMNKKYEKPFPVEVCRAPLTRYSVATFRKLVDPNGTAIRDLPRLDWEPEKMGPKEFASTFKQQAPKLQALLGTVSASFDDILDMTLKLDIPDEQRVYLALNAASNPYTKLEAPAFGRETAKALLRRRVRAVLMDPVVMKIIQLRRSKQGVAFERRSKLAEYAVNEMRQRGTFIHTMYDDVWYVDQVDGKVVSLTPHSERLKQLITIRLGVNPVDQEHRHIKEEIIARAMELPATGRVGDISFYDPDANMLSIHLGGRDVLQLSKHGVDLSKNGEDNLFFNLPPSFEPLPIQMLDLDADYSGWWENFFPGMPNLLGMTEAQAAALLRVWITFIFFQSAAASRPIVVMLGQYGSGKSTMLTAIMRLIYGVQAGLLKISTQAAFDTSLSNQLLAFYDNVDTHQPWLNERLATAIARVSDQKRKLYTDNDPYSVTNRAMVGITSRNPPFMQEDIIDRILHFNLMRYEDIGVPLKIERLIYANITANRHIFMSGLIQDAWKVLRTPKPGAGNIQWRLADFVDMGNWIASTLGIDNDFNDGLAALKIQQRGLTLEADQTLVEALQEFAKRCKSADKWRTASELWEELLTYTSDDMQQTLKQKYKNATVAAKKLYSIHGLIKKVIPIEYEVDTERGFKRWRINKG